MDGKGCCVFLPHPPKTSVGSSNCQTLLWSCSKIQSTLVGKRLGALREFCDATDLRFCIFTLRDFSESFRGWAGRSQHEKSFSQTKLRGRPDTSPIGRRSGNGPLCVRLLFP